MVPKSFTDMLHELTRELTGGLSETVIRTLAVHRVANPVLQVKILKQDPLGRLTMVLNHPSLQLLLELQPETEDGQDARDMIIDRILWGIVSDGKYNPRSATSFVKVLWLISFP